MNPPSPPPRCTGCSKPLEPAWKLCPFCGVLIPRVTRVAPPATIWQLWNRYHRHLRDGLLPYLRSLVAASAEDLAAKVEVCHPDRYTTALAAAMRRLTALARDTRLPPEFRHALTKLAEYQHHEARIPHTLTPAIAEVSAAVQALIDAGDIDPGALQRVEGYLERRDRASTFAQLGAAVTGLDSGMLRIVGHVLAAWLDGSRSNTRQERWQAACLELAAAGDRLIDDAWTYLAWQTHDAGLMLREASELRAIEAEAGACWQTLAEQQETRDGSFEQTLTRAHALARAHPDAYPMRQLVKHADLLAEVRGQLVGNWTSRLCIGIAVDTLARAQQHFLRLLPGDGVLAFFGTTVFGQGKAGLALTTSSVQWLGDEQVPRWVGYAQLRTTPIAWTDEHLVIGGEQIGKFTAHDAEVAGRALRACVELSTVNPGPAVCPCGAPGHWLMFGTDEARCPGCGGAVNYV